MGKPAPFYLSVGLEISREEGFVLAPDVGLVVWVAGEQLFSPRPSLLRQIMVAEQGSIFHRADLRRIHTQGSLVYHIFKDLC